MEKIIKVMSFLNLLDASKKVSITNTALFVILAKVACSPFDWASAVSLFVVCLNYDSKRRVAAKAAQESAVPVEPSNELESKLSDLQSTVTNLALKVGLK